MNSQIIADIRSCFETEGEEVGMTEEMATAIIAAEWKMPVGQRRQRAGAFAAAGLPVDYLSSFYGVDRGAILNILEDEEEDEEYEDEVDEDEVDEGELSFTPEFGGGEDEDDEEGE